MNAKWRVLLFSAFVFVMVTFPAAQAQYNYRHPNTNYGLDAALIECEQDIRKFQYKKIPPGYVHHFELTMPCTSDLGEIVQMNGGKFKYVESFVADRVCTDEGEQEYCDPMQIGGFRSVYYYNLDMPQVDPSQLGPPQCNITVGNPINIASRNKYEEVVDLSDARGLLELKRYYNSYPLLPNIAPLGKGWTHTYSSRLVSYQNGADASAKLALHTGQRLDFEKQDGVWVSKIPGVGRLIEDAGSDSDRWTYHEGNGNFYSFDSIGRLASFVKSGMRVSLSYSFENSDKIDRVSDGSGRYLEFTYNDSGQIDGAFNSTGQSIIYQYTEINGVRSLVEVTHGDSSGFKYEYSNNLLSKISDRSNNVIGQYTYSTLGVPIATENKQYAANYTVTYEKAPTASDPTTVVAVKKNGLFWNRITLKNYGKRVLPTNYTFAGCSGNGDDQQLWYDDDGRKTRTQGFNGLTTYYSYDSAGRLASLLYEGQIEEDGGEDSYYSKKRGSYFTWDDRFDLIKTVRKTNVLGEDVDTLTLNYNDRAQVISRSQADPQSVKVKTSTLSYCEDTDVSNGVCPIVGLITSNDGLRDDVVDVTAFTYRMEDDPGCIASGVSCQYRKGDLWKTIKPFGMVSEILGYDSNGRQLTTKAPDGLITEYAYNDGGLLSAVRILGSDSAAETDDLITSYEYWPSKSLKKVTRPGGAMLSYGYDNYDRLISVTDGEGGSVNYALDADGNHISESIKDGDGILKKGVSRVYDIYGNLLSEKDGENNSTAYEYYGGNGVLRYVTDPKGMVTDVSSDALGRRAMFRQNYGGTSTAVSRFTYDYLGNVAKVTDPRYLDTTYGRDAFGNLVQVVSPDSGTSQFTYDSSGNRTGQVDARGQVSSFTYDALNRLTSLSYFGSSEDNVNFIYDAAQAACGTNESLFADRLAAISDASGSTKYCYDNFGRIVRKMQVTNGITFTVGYSYTKSGKLKTLTYPDGSIADYVHDAQNRVIEVGVKSLGGDRKILVSGITYLPFGPATGWTYGNGRSVSRTYDLNYRPVSILDQAAGGLNLGFTYDSVGNLTTLRKADLAEPARVKFGYDSLYRLESFKDGASNAIIESYSYDATGNRKSFANQSGSQAYIYKPGTHHLVSIAGVGRTHNEVGSTTAIGGQLEFIYNASSRLSQVRRGGATAMHYLYNGKGERVRRYAAGTDVTSLYDESGRWLGDYGSNGSPIQQVILLDGLPVGLLADASGVTRLHYVETDHVGTPRAVID